MVCVVMVLKIILELFGSREVFIKVFVNIIMSWFLIDIVLEKNKLKK